MREKWLWFKFNFYNALCGVVLNICHVCNELGRRLVKSQKDIYYEITGKEI